MIVKGRENRPTNVLLSEEDISFFGRQSVKRHFSLSPVAGQKEYEVYADNIVGAIKLPSGIEFFIEPKIPLPNVFKMLSFVEGLYNPLAEKVHYSKDMGLFDIIANMYGQELKLFARKGLKSEYMFLEETKRKIQGRILIGKSIKQSKIYDGQVICRFNELSVDTFKNRAIIKAGKALIRSSLIKSGTKKMIGTSLNQLPIGSIKDSFDILNFGQISFDRSTNHYKRIIFLSKFILERMAFSQKSGDNPFPGFLLNMASLFEKYVESSLKQHFKGEICVRPQIKDNLDLNYEVSIQPDFLFFKETKVICIADTKYKNFSEKSFVEADVYQMMAYLIRHKCKHGYLVYPASDDKTGIVKSLRIANGESEFLISALCIDIGEPKEVSMFIEEHVKICA